MWSLSRWPLRMSWGMFVAVALLPWATLRAQTEPDGLQMLQALENVLTQAIERNQRSVVSIARVRDDGARIVRDQMGFMHGVRQPMPTDPDFVPNEFATGVVVSTDGLILTNYHVLGDVDDGRNSYWVTTVDRKVYQAQIKAADPRSDLAVLEIEARDLTPVTFGPGDKVRRGQIVIALGNPYAIARDGQCSASWGIISNVLRKAPPHPQRDQAGSKPTLHHYGTLIQTDARLNLGSSGGALVNLRGEMIGLTTSLAALSGYEQPGGYAIPVDETFLRLVEALKKGREAEFGFLGVQPENPTAEQVRQGIEGARVRRVEVGTPAAQAGLREGDLITHVNGVRIFDADGLVLTVGKRDVEERVQLQVLRDRRPLTIEVRLAKFPVSGKKVFTPPPAWRGIRVDYASTLYGSPLARDLDRALLQGCVAIIDVQRDSVAWEKGLRPGMLISRVDGVGVSTPGEFSRQVQDKEGTVRLSLVGEPRPAEEVSLPAP